MKNWRTTWWEKSNCVCVLIVEAEFDTIDNGTSQSQLVGIFQIIADRDAFGNGADDEIFFILHFFEDIAKEYPQIESNSLIVDNTCMQLVMHPEQFDVMVMPNLYGDIVSDLTSGLIGGLGLLPSCNKGDDYAMYEAVHGSAPDIAGKHIANPSALLLSACMMLEDLHQESVATKIRNALNKTFEERKVLTFDLGGSASTDAFTDEIIKNLQYKRRSIYSSSSSSSTIRD